MTNTNASIKIAEVHRPFMDELPALMAKKLVSPKELAKDLGVTPSAIHNWLRGQMPDLENIIKLRKYFDRPYQKYDPVTKTYSDVTTNSHLFKPEINKVIAVVQEEPKPAEVLKSLAKPEQIKMTITSTKPGKRGAASLIEDINKSNLHDITKGILIDLLSEAY
jgi:transcriptional regulator with XRE-family HTH domain